MRRDDISLYLGPADRARLETLLTDRNTPRKVGWRAEIILATADGYGTNEIMRVIVARRLLQQGGMLDRLL